MMKERYHYMFCSDCGCAFEEEEIFRKTYTNTAICLCRECALKLAREIISGNGIVLDNDEFTVYLAIKK